MSVSEAIDSESVRVVLKTRQPDSYDSDGRSVAGAENDDQDILACIQPASGRKLMDLPEGVRDRAAKVGWSRYSLDTDDTIVYSGTRYRVIHVSYRPENGFRKFALEVQGD